MTPRLFHAGRVALHAGDCREVLKELPANHFDAACVDPPYELGFMSRHWDKRGVAHEPETWAAVLRVLKPGAHLVAFHAPKNWHRLALAIEDAGFEIRDTLLFLFGSGFPKSHDVSKAIDRALGAEREVTGIDMKRYALLKNQISGSVSTGGQWKHGPRDVTITAPASDHAKQFDGFGTALKPAYEPIVLARKPLSESTIAANVLKWGTGVINIDGCRIEHANSDDLAASQSKNPGRSDLVSSDVYGCGRPQQRVNASGRWPANVTHDGSDEVVSGFPETGAANVRTSEDRDEQQTTWSLGRSGTTPRGVADSGGSAARFFYTAKADATDRIGSAHPTVKPLDLMQWLVRLVTPPRGHILDCFAGTGTTAEAALREGFRCTLIEREAEYLADIERRMSLVFEGETGRSVAMAKLKPEGEPLPLFPEAAE